MNRIGFKLYSGTYMYGRLNLDFTMVSEYDIYKKYLACDGNIGAYLSRTMLDNKWKVCEVHSDHMSYVKTVKFADYDYDVKVAISETIENAQHMGSYGVQWIEILNCHGTADNNLEGTMYEFNKYKHYINIIAEHLLCQGIPIAKDNQLKDYGFWNTRTFNERWHQINSILEMDEHYCLDDFYDNLKRRCEWTDYEGLSEEEAFNKLCEEHADAMFNHVVGSDYNKLFERTIRQISEDNIQYRESWCKIANAIYEIYETKLNARLEAIFKKAGLIE